MSGTKAEFEPGAIPGDRVQLEVLAHDGFFRASGRSENIDVPPRKPEAAIIHPPDDAEIPATQPLHLWGTVIGSAAPALDEDVHWELDGMETAEGMDTRVTGVEPGRHELVLRVKDVPAVRTSFRVTTA